MGWGAGEGAYVYTSAYMFRNINREVEGFSIITRSLTMEIERNLVQMIRTGPPELSKTSWDLVGALWRSKN